MQASKCSNWPYFVSFLFSQFDDLLICYLFSYRTIQGLSSLSSQTTFLESSDMFETCQGFGSTFKVCYDLTLEL